MPKDIELVGSRDGLCTQTAFIPVSLHYIASMKERMTRSQKTVGSRKLRFAEASVRT